MTLAAKPERAPCAASNHLNGSGSGTAPAAGDDATFLYVSAYHPYD